MPTVSVIISSHNYARYVGQAIESALAQTRKPLDVIVVDDGSTDESPAIIRSFGSRIVPIIKPNAGQASALNAGFAASRGEVIIFLDSDDVLLPHAVAQVESPFTDELSKLHWPMNEIDRESNPVGRVVPASTLAAGDLRDDVLADGPRSETNVWPPTSGNGFSRAFLSRVMPIPESTYQTCPDLYLCGVAPLYGRIGRTEEPLSLWRAHAQNNTWVKPFAQRVGDYVRLWEACCADVAAHARKLGHLPDQRRWIERSWWHRLARDVDRLRRAIPDGSPFILIDDDQWACASIDSRRAAHLVEKDGVSWGAPADDTAAIAALKQRRDSGTRHLVLAPEAAWWAVHYADFMQYLSRRATRRDLGEGLILFEME